jgi:hypothetical protein
MLNQYRLLYQITPIFLTNGIAGPIAGSMLPILALLNADAFGALYQTGAEQQSGQPFQLDDAFAIFQPIPGGTLSKQTPAEYPYANLNIAANAIVRNPLDVSLVMMTPMKTQQAWALKLATMTALKNTLDTHNNAGGTYTIFTPAFTYINMLMTGLTDVSTAQSPLPQNIWRWDFHKPLVAANDLASALSNLMTQITNGAVSNAEITGALTAQGNAANVINVEPNSSAPTLLTTPFAAYSP